MKRITSSPSPSLKYIATTISTLLILVAVLLPGSNLPDIQFTGIDKVAHVGLFMLWSLSVRRDFGPSFRWVACLLVGLTFSWLTEVFQIVVDGRTFDYSDIIADAAGLALGLLLGRPLLQWIGKFIRI
jgi:VanZ family protein